MSVTTGNPQNRMAEAQQATSPNARFMVGAVPAGQTVLGRVGNAQAVSLVTHVVGFFFVLFIVSRMPDVVSPAPQTELPHDIVWLATPGPGGGGGGGGNKTPEPPRKVELPGVQKITVPVTKPPKLDKPEPPKDVKPEPPLTIPAQPMAAAVQELPGAISAVAAPTISQGSGSGGGAGTGNGTGVGSGSGSGLGPGSGGGTGGGVYHPGNGVTTPRLIKEVKPT